MSVLPPIVGPRAARILRRSRLVFAMLAIASCAAHANWDAEALRLYGGHYAHDCADAGSPQVVIDASGMVIAKAGRRVVARVSDLAFSYFGQSPPPGFQVALMGTSGARQEVVFLLFRDRGGRYVSLGMDPKVLATLGMRDDGTLRYRDCDGARKASDGRAAVQDERAQKQAEREALAASPLGDPAFKAAYRRALGPKARERWLATMDGPAPEPKRLVVAGLPYTRIAFCKAHDCHDNSVVLLWSPERATLYGKVLEAGRVSTWLGAPPPAVALEIERLWRAEWRQR